MSTIYEISFTCPYCGKIFNYKTQASYTIFGKMLDFKPYGAACIPTPVPKCPKCGFVFFNNLFSEDEITKLKKKIETSNIFKTEPDMPNYYYLAREFELLDKNIDDIIHYYQCAIWQGRTKLIEKLSTILFSYIDKVATNNKYYYHYKLIQIDLLRRLSKFDMATDLITSLKNDIAFPKNYRKLLDYQIILIELKDTDEHEISEM
jgi:uncharacterized C2H2 Zn-finger protein